MASPRRTFVIHLHGTEGLVLEDVRNGRKMHLPDLSQVPERIAESLGHPWPPPDDREQMPDRVEER